MRTVEYLDAIKAKHGIKSDYKLAQALGVMDKQISHYRRRGVTFGDAVCIRVAELLELNPGAVAADIHAERAKLEPEKKLWRDVANKLRGAAAPLLLLIVAAVMLRDGEQLALMSAAFALPLDGRFYTLYEVLIAGIGLTIALKPLMQRYSPSRT